MTTLLLTGSTGLLGPYLRRTLASIGEVVTIGRHGADITADLTDASTVADAVRAVRPAVAVHAAAWTDVDGCEADPDRAFAANAAATTHLVAALAPETLLVHISTDQVYGAGVGPHAEADVAPVNAYGRSKLAGEQAAARQPRHLLLRTNIFGPSLTEGRESLSDFVLTNLRAHRAMTLFTDVQFTPLHLESLADLVVEGIDRELLGTFNAGSRDGRSKHDFGVLLANHLGLPDEPITPGRSTDVDGRAPRPLDLRLRVEAIEAALGRPMPTLADEIARL